MGHLIGPIELLLAYPAHHSDLDGHARDLQRHVRWVAGRCREVHPQRPSPTHLGDADSGDGPELFEDPLSLLFRRAYPLQLAIVD